MLSFGISACFSHLQLSFPRYISLSLKYLNCNTYLLLLSRPENPDWAMLVSFLIIVLYSSSYFPDKGDDAYAGDKVVAGYVGDDFGSFSLLSY